jgi:hypothetical protein
MKITAIVSGTCYDCSCDHLVLPEGMNIEEQKRLWRNWYNEYYCPQLSAGQRPKFTSFVDFLIENGAKRPTDEQLTVWEDC